METLLHIGLSNTLVAIGLAVLAAVVGAVTRRPALAHGLWLLVLLKLVTPPFVHLPILPTAPLPSQPAPPTVAEGPTAVEEAIQLTPEELAAKGANESLIHVDWMIGSSEIDLDGITAAGGVEPLMRKGEWAF